MGNMQSRQEEEGKATARRTCSTALGRSGPRPALVLASRLAAFSLALRSLLILFTAAPAAPHLFIVLCHSGHCFLVRGTLNKFSSSSKRAQHAARACCQRLRRMQHGPDALQQRVCTAALVQLEHGLRCRARREALGPVCAHHAGQHRAHSLHQLHCGEPACKVPAAQETIARSAGNAQVAVQRAHGQSH